MKELVIKTAATTAATLFIAIWLEFLVLIVVGLYKLLVYAERVGL